MGKLNAPNIDNTQTIKLLRKLIDKTPAGPDNRLRLLRLLHASRLKVEFMEEAFMYKAYCDLTFDTNWEFV